MLATTSAGVYRPRTKETAAAYETLLNTIHGMFGDQPADVLRGAADEVLSVLKNQNMTGTVPSTLDGMHITTCTFWHTF